MKGEGHIVRICKKDTYVYLCILNCDVYVPIWASS